MSEGARGFENHFNDTFLVEDSVAEFDFARAHSEICVWYTQRRQRQTFDSKMMRMFGFGLLAVLAQALLASALSLSHLNSQQILHQRTHQLHLDPPGPVFDPEWYRKTIFYQIYPASFQDGNGDGVGDLLGIASRLQHFKDIGVGGVWLSPICDSPMVDNGYDVSNFTNINPLFGTLDDFRTLMKRVKELGLRLVMDLVPNHSSTECEWFKKSQQKIAPYTDYYVWHAGDPARPVQVDGKTRNGVPNNWPSRFDGSAWEWDEIRKEYYFHAFLLQQADLNYRNEDLKNEMKNVLKFWLDLGVDGFRVDAYDRLFETVNMLNNNETRNTDSGIDDPLKYAYYNHELIVDQPETFENLVDWRNFITSYTKSNPNRDHIFLVTECYKTDVAVSMKYDTYMGQKAADFNFNFGFVNVTNTTTGRELAETAQNWLKFLPPNSWPNWVLGNHDKPRLANRAGMNLIDAMNTLSLTLPGTPFTYYGEEIGMVDNYNLTKDQVKDKTALTPEHEKEWWKYTRDFERTPMQWKNIEPNADFSPAWQTPYLPVNQDSLATVNVADEDAGNYTHLQVYKQLAILRQEAAFRDNKDMELLLADDNIFSYMRQSNSGDKYVVIVDVRRNTTLPVNLIDLRQTHKVPDFALVEVADVNSWASMALHKGALLSTNAVPMVPGGALVLKL